MATTKLSSKGQIVVPKSIRDALDWPAGAELTIEKGNDSVTLRRSNPFPRTTLNEVAGMFKFHRPITDQEIEAAIEAELQDRWRRKG